MPITAIRPYVCQQRLREKVARSICYKLIFCSRLPRTYSPSLLHLPHEQRASWLLSPLPSRNRHQKAMDFVLEIADHFALDNLYAKLVPVAAFLPPPTINGTTWEHSTWQQLVSHLPHPPFPYEVYRTYPEQFLAPVSAWPRDYVPRQCLSLIITTLVGVHLLYFLFSTFSYYFIFDHDMMKHPRFLKNQVRQEIVMSLRSFPGMMLLTLPWFEAEVLGYTKVYDNVDEYGWTWFFLSIPVYVPIQFHELFLRF